MAVGLDQGGEAPLADAPGVRQHRREDHDIDRADAGALLLTQNPNRGEAAPPRPRMSETTNTRLNVPDANPTWIFGSDMVPAPWRDTRVSAGRHQRRTG